MYFFFSGQKKRWPWPRAPSGLIPPGGPSGAFVSRPSQGCKWKPITRSLAFAHALCDGARCPDSDGESEYQFLWDMPQLLTFQSNHSHNFTVLHFCQFGARWVKPILLLLLACPYLSDVGKTCSGRGVCSRTGKPHVSLRGKDPTGTFWTLRAQPYPRSFTRAVASHAMSHVASVKGRSS